MSDPIKISIEAIFQFIFFPMSLYLSGLCGKLVNNSPAGVFVTWSAQDDPVWENLQSTLTCEVLKIEIAGHSHHINPGPHFPLNYWVNANWHEGFINP